MNGSRGETIENSGETYKVSENEVYDVKIKRTGKILL
jgi:hypothetical protein